jgi:hypothetical protein
MLPVGPANPVAPVAPLTPTAPVIPVEPINPGAPGAPGLPSRPIIPGIPGTPLHPGIPMVKSCVFSTLYTKTGVLHIKSGSLTCISQSDKTGGINLQSLSIDIKKI